jgi:amino acid adenylation domain-containing protein
MKKNIAEFLSYLATLDIKLWVDGVSGVPPQEARLRCNAPKEKLTPALKAELAERKAEILAYIGNTNKLNYTQESIPPIPRSGNLPLSFAQQRLWFIDQFEADSSLYNLPTALHIKGALNVAALSQTLNEIVRRHEALRTSFVSVEGQPIQVITPNLSVSLPIIDLQELPETEREAEVLRLVANEVKQPFNLTKAPLLRVTLLRLSELEHVVMFTMHHIVSDGWSMEILIQELGTLYLAFSNGEASPLAELPIQYADFAAWQRQWLTASVLESQLTYWQQQLQGAPELLDLPCDRPRPAIQSFKGASHDFQLLPELSTRLRNFSHEHGATIFMVLLAAFKTLLCRYTHSNDIVVGSPIANRNHKQIEGLIGFFVNTLVLRTDLSGNPSFVELLLRVREVALGAYAHQDLPFEQLLEKLKITRNTSHTPLFQVMFVLQNAQASPQIQLPGLTLSPLETDSGTSMFDLTLDMRETAKGLIGTFEYNTDLFEADTITRMVSHLQTLLDAIVANPQAKLSELALLTPAELHQLLVEWNDTKAEYPLDKCIHELFEVTVERTPNAVAVVFEDQQLTYRQLNQRANQLAHYLRSLGVQPGVLVGICVERSLSMVIGLLGILKAGGAYVPLDPSYPQERLTFMLEDSQTPVLLSQQHLVEQLGNCGTQVICLDTDWEKIKRESRANPRSGATSNNLAYIIYTSGSTGKPKGVLTKHSNVVRLFASTQAWFKFSDRDVWTLFHSYAFDFSVWELWGALLHGGRLVVVPYWVSRSPEAFYNLLCTQGVTVLNQTPSAFRQLIQADASVGRQNSLSLRLIIFGGEALELQSLKPWFERHGDRSPQLVNMYGITETTVHVTYRPLTTEDLKLSVRSVIGCPIPDLQVYILDRHQQLVPIGVRGEMYIGGAGLARGYLKRPELTAQKFVPNPFSNKGGERLYKTSDLARYLPNGDIEYIGRIDHQVKIRGFRIELGEIEAALLQHSAIRETLVVAREDKPGDKQLVAYVVVNPQSPIPNSQSRDFRSFLKSKLPDYMLPGAFVILESLPLTHNGKVDTRSLPAPDMTRPELQEAFVAPKTQPEKVLAEVWAEVLHLEKVGIHDNFFALGGDSIRTIQVRSLTQQRGFNFSLQQLFQHQTIYELAQNLESTATANTLSVQPFSLICATDQEKLPIGIEDAYPLTKLQAGMLFHSEYSPDTAVYHDIFSIQLQAVLNIEALQTAIQHLVKRHPVLRTSFDLSSFKEPLQLVHQKVNVPLYLEDWRHLSDSEQTEALNSWFETEKSTNFAWTRPPLLKFQVHHRTEEKFQFTFCFHHAILDGWSVACLFTELFQCYCALLAGQEMPSEPQITSSFRDFVDLERRELASVESCDFWINKIKNVALTRLPRWQTSNQAKQNHSGVQEVVISPKTSEGLKRLADSAGVPLKSVLLAAHLRVLSLLSGESVVLTGLVSNGRVEEKDGERVLGLFLNTLPFTLELPRGTWTDLVKQTFAAERELLPFRRYPLAELQQILNRENLFETIFNYTHFHVYQNVFSLDNVQIIDEVFFEETNFALVANFGLDSINSSVLLMLEYKTAEFCQEQIKAISSYYAKTLELMATQALARYEFLSLLSDQEQSKLLLEWNNTQVNYPKDVCLHQLFEATVERTPLAPAVEFADQQLTYRELNHRANQLAHYLRSLGVKPEVKVGICVERSLSMVIGLLGILKAGGAYIPLDPAYPSERLAFILEDAQAPVLLTQANLVEGISQHKGKVVCLDADWSLIVQQSQENLCCDVTTDNLAYVIYTSGSTGKPKGVQIPHGALSNFLQAMRQTPELTEQDTLLAVTTISFDIAALEFFLPIIVGGRLVIISREIASDATQLSAKMADSKATVMQATPATWQLLMAAGWQGNHSLKILCGGEALPRHLANQLLDKCGSVWNMYGPTETTIWSSACLVATDSSTVPISHPIANTQFYILDQHGQLVPVGVPGELHIGGQGLARGYLNRPLLTAQKFIPNPFSDKLGTRLYKTGDKARYLPSGEIEYIGRIDYQVKLRGFRIELGEIEAVINQHPSVTETVVIDREDIPGHKRLVAYLVLERSQILEPNQLRSFLKQQLPEYMIPSAFVELEALPLTPNGKVDRRALPVPESAVITPGETYVAPRTPIEEVLAGIWTEVLGVNGFGIDDNFFELGGHSLLAIQVISRLREAFQIELPLSYLFESPTIAGCAKKIETKIRTEKGLVTEPIVPISRRENLPLSFAQQRLWFLDQLDPGNPTYNIPTAVRLSGSLNVAILERSFNELISRHEVLRTVFPTVAGQPVGAIAPANNFTLSVLDLRTANLSPLQREAQAQRIAIEEAECPFNLAQGPLLRVMLLQLDEAEYVLLLTMHHIISDLWSMGILVRELTALYQAFDSGKSSPFLELPVQYADFAVWQRKCLQDDVLEKQLAYWKQQLEGSPPVLALPTDRPRPLQPTSKGKTQSLLLPKDLSEALKSLSQQEGVTLFMSLLAVYNALLYYYTRQEDILVGSPITNRNRTEIEDLIGFFINNLVLRTNLSANPSFRELLRRVREVTLEAYVHQDLPFEKLVGELHLERDVNYHPLFQVWFTLENISTPNIQTLTLTSSGLTLSPFEVEKQAVPFDLALILSENSQGIVGCFEYKIDLFDATTIQHMAEQLKILLQCVVAQPDIRLNQLVEKLNESKQQKQLVEEQEYKNIIRQKLGQIQQKSHRQS